MSEKQRQRARRDVRANEPEAIRLTERDIDVMQAVYEYDVLSTQHLQTLFFPSVHSAYSRLASLYHHGFLNRHFLGAATDKMNKPILYVLDQRGAELLRSQRGIEAIQKKRTKDLTFQFLEHTLAINTFRVAIAKAAEQNGWELLKWQGENDLKKDYDYVSIRNDSGRLKDVSVIPDSYFALQTPRGVTHAFLELDRGKMTVGKFKTKILAYQVYYDSGAYTRRFGTRSLRVLTVTLGQGRLQNLRRATEEADGKQRFWFACLEQIRPETVLLAPIWQVATNSALQPLVELRPLSTG